MNTSEEKEDLMQQFGDQIPFSSPSVVERYICGIVTDDDLANAWVDESGVKYSSDHLRLLKAPADLETYVIKEGCKIICDEAFRDCTKLTSIEIPDSVTRIGDSAFWGCTGLTSIGIPSGVTRIGNYAFYGSTGLASIEIPSSVTGIGAGAFSGCSSLESITLPFVGDKPHTATDNYQYPFGYIFGTKSYVGGTATKQYYYGDSTSSTTSTTYSIPSSLKSVTITGSRYIPFSAFYGCTGLTSIGIPDSVTRIGDGAF